MYENPLMPKLFRVALSNRNLAKLRGPTHVRVVRVSKKNMTRNMRRLLREGKSQMARL